MAEKRMFSKRVTDSDSFIELSSAAQALYFHLNQTADDDGFSNQVQVAMMKAHASVDDLKILLLKNFVIRFESGVIVIKHWRIHNTLRKDRHSPTSFQEELAQLNIKDNLSYSLDDSGCQLVAERLPDGCHSIGKVSIDKGSKEEKRVGKAERFTPPTLDEIKTECGERGYVVNADTFFDHYQSNGWMVGRVKMKDWKATLRNWNRKDSEEKGRANGPTSRPAGKPTGKSADEKWGVKSTFSIGD